MGCGEKLKGTGPLLGPLLGMLMVQGIATGLQILSRVILTQGTFVFALLAYRHLLASLFIAPFAFYLERDNGVKLTIKVWFWVFINSLTGIIMGMGMYYYGLRDTTATYATHFLNLIPIVTFFLSLILRMDSLRLNTRRGKIRLIGTFLSVGGALILTLYKGKVFHIGINHHHHDHHDIAHKVKSNMTRGTIMLIISCFGYATFYVVQVKLLKAFPSKYWATMLMCGVAAIQATVIGLCIDRSKSSWKLGWNLQLTTIVYSAVLASAMTFYLISWAVATKGPTYPAMFNPLCLVFTALIEALFLGEDLFSGSVLGMVVTIIGLYSFLWGTEKPRKMDLSLPGTVPSSEVRGGGGEAKGDSGDELQGPHLMMATVVPAPSPKNISTPSKDGDDNKELNV